MYASSVIWSQAAILRTLAAASAIGVAKEARDCWLNRKAVAAGLPPPHGVGIADALATAAGGVAVLAASFAGGGL